MTKIRLWKWWNSKKPLKIKILSKILDKSDLFSRHRRWWHHHHITRIRTGGFSSFPRLQFINGSIGRRAQTRVRSGWRHHHVVFWGRTFTFGCVHGGLYRFGSATTANFANFLLNSSYWENVVEIFSSNCKICFDLHFNLFIFTKKSKILQNQNKNAPL